MHLDKLSLEEEWGIVREWGRGWRVAVRHGEGGIGWLLGQRKVHGGEWLLGQRDGGGGWL
jgi:hypothetical protein